MIISVIRTILLYIVIILAIRIMGKRQIGELQTSELVVTLLISDIAAIPMQNTEQSLFHRHKLLYVTSVYLLSLYRLSAGLAASFGISQTPAIFTAPGIRPSTQ